ncbi:hypothetical protein EJB05_16411, partial [Eragrostis curvula]
MRLACSAFLRRAAAMSSSSSYGRGTYPRRDRGRGYSARSSRPPYPNAGPEFVSGDSHLNAVRAANDSLRRGGFHGPSPQYRQGPHQSPPQYRQEPHQPPQQYWQGPHQQPQYGYNYGYGYGQPEQPGPLYGAVPYNYGQPQQPPPMLPGPQYSYGPPIPYYHDHPRLQQYGHAPGNAGFHPDAPQLIPRLADYRRRWQLTKQKPPHQAERFTVVSYNILADYLAQEHRFLYERIPPCFLDWNWRKNKLVFEFGLWSPDILCLQEVDKFTDLEQELARKGYNGIWKMRTGNAVDGCAIFWKTTRFQLRHVEDIEFNKLGLRDNVAQICVLESVVPRNAPTDSTASPSDPEQAKQVVVCNTHVLYNPKRGDIKLGQVRTLLDTAYNVSKMWNNAPVIVCGDFNSTPKSPLYNFISEQKLNLTGLARSTISGQVTTPQKVYTGYNVSRFHPPSTNSKAGNIALPNGHKPQTETGSMVNNSRPVLTDASSESRNTKSSNSCGNTIPCSGSTNLGKQVLLRGLEGPGKDHFTSEADARANKTEGEESTAADKSSEGLKHSLEEKKVSHVQRDLSGDVIPDEFTCAFEENGAQPDELLAVLKDNPDEKEKALESMLPGNDKCITNEPESCNSSGSQKFPDSVHQMSNMRLEGDSSTEVTYLESPAEPVHQSNGAVSDASGNQCTSGVISKHSVSSKDDSEDNAGAFADETIRNEVSCSDVNSDPTFFEELTGISDHLLEGDEDQLSAISDASPSSQQMVNSNESYYISDPFKWSPDEIRAATGKDECTYVEHNLKLRSVYTDVEDFNGTKDANKEPLVTSYNRKFMGTVDYIWASEDLQTVKVLDTFPKEILEQTIGFPTKKWGSDHIALATELAFKK